MYDWQLYLWNEYIIIKKVLEKSFTNFPERLCSAYSRERNTSFQYWKPEKIQLISSNFNIKSGPIKLFFKRKNKMKATLPLCLEIGYFQVWFLYKNDWRIYATEIIKRTMSEFYTIQDRKQRYSTHCYSEVWRSGTIVNRVCHSLNGWSLEFTSTFL